MRPRAEAAGIELHTAMLPLSMTRDADALQLVLHNLLDNAVKYSPSGTQVEIALRDEDGTAVVSVRDQGQGMDAEALRNAFVPFWRGRDSAAGGTGLGLHLVRELVRAHGGTVAAASGGPGRGSEFTVRLPRRGGSA
jgi:signal transduction histidine kinase